MAKAKAKAKRTTNEPTRRGGPNETKPSHGRATKPRRAVAESAAPAKTKVKATKKVAAKTKSSTKTPKALDAKKTLAVAAPPTEPKKAEKAEKSAKKAEKAQKEAAKAEKKAKKAEKKAAEKEAAKAEKKAKKAAKADKADKPAKAKKLPVVPPGYHSVVGTMNQTDAAATIAFCERVFDAKLRHSIDLPDGKILHAEIQIGDSVIMISDAVFDPPRAASFYVYVKDVDATIARAHRRGATLKSPIANHFWGDRSGTIIDPAGNHWTVATYVEEVAPKEMERRIAEAMDASSEPTAG